MEVLPAKDMEVPIQQNLPIREFPMMTKRRRIRFSMILTMKDMILFMKMMIMIWIGMTGIRIMQTE